ncbi:hypothetical protein [Aeromicrobium sp. Leaf350]|uniref:hypothetical protein n=1 Tax=Aeromicrobium sp. Leaf350 TaxID=2876565 RepID=UPI001E417AFB|nr:hypothetical protein [Aeromicrobium sp. Leaf350]
MTANRRPLASSPFQPPKPPEDRTFVVGQRVAHDTYGLGRVVSVSGMTAVTVDFGTRVCHLALPCVALDIL